MMRFIFNGTIEELKEVIHTKSQEFHKDIIVYHNEPSTLEIGFQRLGHSGGRFFIANITEESGTVILSGDAKDIYSVQSPSKARRVIDSIGSWMLGYFVFAFVPILLWLCIFQLNHIYIPIIFPVLIMALCRMNAKRQDEKIDTDFIKFMSIFTTYADVESEAYKPSWDSTYKKLDLARGKLQSFRDDDEDMLLITYEDGMLIDVGYITEDNTYCITVVSSDTAESWSKPLGVFTLKDKSKLASELQKAIYKFRSNG